MASPVKIQNFRYGVHLKFIRAFYTRPGINRVNKSLDSPYSNPKNAAQLNAPFFESRLSCLASDGETNICATVSSDSATLSIKNLLHFHASEDTGVKHLTLFYIIGAVH